MHHRKCRSNGGGNEKRNISSVTNQQHRAWHLLFQNKEAPEIAKLINEVWLDPDVEFIVKRR